MCWRRPRVTDLWEKEMVAKADCINIGLLAEHARLDETFQSLNGRSALGRTYGALVRELTQDVPRQPGFYVWAERRSAEKAWGFTYVGIATPGRSGRNGLQQRLRNELLTERSFIWAKQFNWGGSIPDSVDRYGRQCYPNHWLGGRCYRWKHDRAIEKAGTTHIAWVAVDSFDLVEFLGIEAGLIADLGPAANRHRPTRPEFQERAEKIRDLLLAILDLC